MNWKDAETDEWLKEGRAALNDADRAKYYGLVQKKVTDEHLWMPVINIAMDQVTNKKTEGRAAAHAVPEHLLQGAGRNPSRSRAGAVEGLFCSRRTR